MVDPGYASLMTVKEEPRVELDSNLTQPDDAHRCSR
jgi:hypothetical protein